MLDSKRRTFAKACIDSGIDHLDTSAHIEKARLIARQKGIENCDDISLLQDIIEEYLRERQRLEDEKRQALRLELKNREAQEKQQLERFASYTGREKTIQHYEDLIGDVEVVISIYEEDAKNAKTIQSAFAAAGNSLETVKTVDQDWALAGGFASALAGPAAGLAVAADIQRKNAEAKVDPEKAAADQERARAYWNNLGTALAEKVRNQSGISKEEYRLALRAKKEYQALKEKSEVLLIDTSAAPERLLSTLEPEVKSIVASESGSVHVSVGVKGGSFIIYDTVTAVIDGSFRALLWNDKGECCGTAAFVLPLTGADEDMELEAWFTEPVSVGESYTIEFARPNLWLSETIGSQKDSGTLSETSADTGSSSVYYDAWELLQTNKKENLEKAATLFASLGSWKDAEHQRGRCIHKLQSIEDAERIEAERIRQEELVRRQEAEAAQRQAEEAASVKKKKTVRVFINSIAVLAIIAAVVFAVNLIQKNRRYQEAVSLMNGDADDRNQAGKLFASLGGFKDADRYLNGFVYYPVRMTRSDYDVLDNEHFNTTWTINYDDSYRIEAISSETIVEESGEKQVVSEAHDLIYDDKGRLIQYTSDDIDGYDFDLYKIDYKEDGSAGTIADYMGHFEAEADGRRAVVEEEPFSMTAFDKYGNEEDVTAVDEKGNPVSLDNGISQVTYENTYSKTDVLERIKYKSNTGDRNRDIEYQYLYFGDSERPEDTDTIMKNLKLLGVIY